tara:strand:+ start:442 stop:597 length:156 start_codon:yes stop_codon:yes gene_type:complete
VKKILFSILIFLKIFKNIKIVFKIKMIEIKKYCGVKIKLKNDSEIKKMIKL